jgi:predicted HicB family RNase H-like nuclease
MSVGDTVVEATEMIEDAKRAWLTAALEDGLDIPRPEALQNDRYGGKFALRLPKSLHRKLAESAESDGVSLNQYMVTLLAERNPLAEVKRLLKTTTEIPEPETSVTYMAKSKVVLPRYLQVVGG